MAASLLPYLTRRLLAAALLLLGVASLTFVLIHAAPGDPADLYLAKEMDPAARQAVLAAYGLDRPLLTQYGLWLAGLARFELGWSISHRRPVVEVMAERIPYTLQITVLGFALQLLLGIGIGWLAARRRGSVEDLLASGGALVVYSLPAFWLGALLIMFFALHLGWLPSSGMRDVIATPITWWQLVADRARHLILPVICLGLGSAAATARYVRAGLLTARSSEYCTAARARGATEARVLGRHAMKHTLLPVITLSGLSVPFLLGGSVLVENVFSWPGIGSLSVEAIYARDYPLVLAAQLLFAMAVVVGNLAADVALVLVDPRLREGSVR